MANLRNRTRVVYFRVSEEEFHNFNELCERHGARNMSDLMRTAMDRMARHNGNEFENEVTLRLQHLEKSLDLLTQTVSEIKLTKVAGAGEQS